MKELTPSTCPACHEGLAYPRSVQTIPGRRDALNLTLRCATCNYSWTVEQQHGQPPEVARLGAW